MANEALVKSVKDIAAKSKAGEAEAAYLGYRDLFSSEAFAGYRPEDRRQALRLMVLAKGAPTSPSPAMREAYEAAAACLASLLPLGDAADYEMLGVCQILLGDEAAAREAFRAGLTLERKRDPQSNLCGSLMKRASMI